MFRGLKKKNVEPEGSTCSDFRGMKYLARSNVSYIILFR